MALSRRTFIGSGLASAAASAVACGDQGTPPPAPAPAAAAPEKRVLFVVQGTFALVNKAGALPPRVVLPKALTGQTAHELVVRVEAKCLQDPDEPEWMPVDGLPDWRARVFAEPVTFDVAGAILAPTAAGPAPGAAGRTCAEKPRHSHARWAYPEFIAKLKEKESDPLKLRDDWAGFAAAYVSLPNGAKWVGRAPRFECDQKATWQIKKGTTPVGSPTGLTDTVAIDGRIKDNGVINYYSGILSAVDPMSKPLGSIKLKFDENVPEVWFIARPEKAEGHPYACASYDDPAPHFDMLYNVVDTSITYRLKPHRASDCAGIDVKTATASPIAYDIFCPGGEIEGG